MTLSIILLNFNKSALTLACIKSLYKQYEKKLKQNLFEIILVDNNSESVSLKELEKGLEQFLEVKLIKNDKNYGFGKGNNIGVEKSSGQFLLFLNNDTIVNDKGIIEMVELFKKDEAAGIVGGQLKNEDGSLQPSTGDFYTFNKALLLLLGGQRFGIVDKSPSQIAEVDWVKGGLLMIKKSVFEKVNGFDENIFMYIEDMELCYRVKKAGYKILFYPSINIIHKEHGSTNRTFAIVNIYKNLLYFYKKHMPKWEFVLLKFIMQLKAVVLIAVGEIVRSNYLKQTYSQALNEIK